MTPWKDPAPDEEPPVVLDTYRPRLRGSPSDLGEEPPRSWSEVGGQINRHLMRFVVGVTRILAEVPEGTVRVWRGVTSIPSAFADRGYSRSSR